MTASALPPLSAFKDLFDPALWAQGEGCARLGRAEVLELNADDPSPGWWSLEADVQSDLGEFHEVSLQFKALPSGRLLIESECDCGAGALCEHAAAAVIQACEEGVVETSAPAPQPARQWPWAIAASTPASPVRAEHEPLERWLRAKDVVRQRQPAAPRMVEPQRMVYVLSSEPHEPPGPAVKMPGAGVPRWLCLWPARVRPLKNKPDQWGKPSLVKNQYGRLFGESEGHGEVFQLLRRWLMGQATATHSWGQVQDGLTLGPASAVQDAIGLQVLQMALATGDVVTLDAKGQIEATWQWGEPREVSWVWHQVPPAAAGQAVRWQVRADLGDEHSVFHLGAPAFYLDAQTHTVGLVPVRQSLAQLADWLTLPPLPEDWMRERAPRLLSLAPPLPAEVVGDLSRVVQGVLPVPHLHVARAPAGSACLLALHLSFDYDGLRGLWAMDAPAEQWVDTPAGRVLLHRQPEAEAQYLSPFMTLGYMAGALSDAPEVWTARTLPGQTAMEASPRLRDQALLSDDFKPFRDKGFVVTLDRSLTERMREATALDMGLTAQSPDGTELVDEEATSARWFNLSLGFEIDGERVNLLPWLPQLLDHVSRHPAREGDDRLWLHAEPDQWWHVPVGPLRPWLATMMELLGERQDWRRADELRLSRFEAMRLAAADEPTAALTLSGAQASSLTDMVQALKQGAGVEPVAIPEGLLAELRPYQHQGLAWLQFLSRHHLGGVLADDMGLGKTLQTIAHLWVEKQAGRLTQPALIVAPTSLMGNWRSELQRFAPGLSTLILHGSTRSERFEDVARSDVVVTTYPLLSRDQEMLVAQSWSVVVLDEAQTIKNTKTQAASVVQSLDARQRLCLSGTPMENHLGEIWSLFNFLMPGYLGSEGRFRQLFRTPIEKHGDAERLTQLRARLAPFMLRRTKGLVAAELPPKIETIEHVTLAPAQAKLYETIRLTTEAKVREALNHQGLARSHITVLDALLKLRQVCCDPRLVPLEAARRVDQSAKLDWLVQNLPEMIAEGRRVLLFSQFTSMLSLIEEQLPALGVTWTKLTGQSTNREALIERFTSGEVPLFLISLKAGGVGLNLPQADTVIHYDPWWNPAVEDQATDRAHRLGQTQTVFVHKLVAEGTLEERILALQTRKAELARGLHGQAGATSSALTEADLDWLLQPLSAGLESGMPSHPPALQKVI